MPTIYEFSTGINKPSLDHQSGKWRIFHGYDTNQRYGFNSFLVNKSVELGVEGIPEVINRAIRNNYFDIKPSNNSLAVAGRYLDDGWAVLAVASYLSDAARVYRYFCCQGNLTQNTDPMLTLIDWYNKQHKYLCFDATPERPLIEDEWEYPKFSDAEQLNQNQQKILDELRKEITPEISQVSLDISELQTIISKLNYSEKQGFSWAFGVTNFVDIVGSGKFCLVQSAQNHLWVIKQKVVQKQRVIDTHSLTYSLNDLASDSPSNIKILIDKLLSEDVAQEEWESIFEGIGLLKSVNRSSLEPITIRLLTLQAILVPKTITSLIQSINQENQKSEFKKKVNSANRKIVRAFENKLLQEIVIALWKNQNDNIITIDKPIDKVYDKLLGKLHEGIWFCLTNMVDETLTRSNDLRLLINNKGLWDFTLRSRVAIDFYHYFNADKTFLTFQAKNFFNHLDDKNNPHKRKIYRYLQSLWYDIDPVITAFAYQRNHETIPGKIYHQIDNTKYRHESSNREEYEYVWKGYINKLQLSNKPDNGMWRRVVQRLHI